MKTEFETVSAVINQFAVDHPKHVTITQNAHGVVSFVSCVKSEFVECHLDDLEIRQSGLGSMFRAKLEQAGVADAYFHSEIIENEATLCGAVEWTYISEAA